MKVICKLCEGAYIGFNTVVSILVDGLLADSIPQPVFTIADAFSCLSFLRL